MSTYLGFPPTNDPFYYFVSYNTEDAHRVGPVVHAMSQSGMKLWYDYGIEYGDNWKTTISTKIKNAQAVILFFTKGILKKNNSYVQREYDIAKFYDRKVYVVMLDKIKKEEIPVGKVAWWVEITEQQCINGYEFTDTAKLAEEISGSLGIQNQTRDKKDHGATQGGYKPAEQYRNAAEQGDASAQYNLGNCYYNGNGVTQNYSEAIRWYRKAAKQEYAGAQCGLGNCYCNGNGVTQNYPEAIKWYRKAAEKGNADAQCNLGFCYIEGNGVTQNDSEAVNWFRKAAEQGLAEAQCILGICYYYGNGVSMNRDEAKFWIKKSAAQGYNDAKNALRELGF